jgi:hypothetical protein
MYAGQFVLSLLTSFFVVFVITMSVQNGVPASMAIMFPVMAWLCFVVPTVGSAILWSNCDRSIAWQKFFSDIFAILVTILVISLVTVGYLSLGSEQSPVTATPQTVTLAGTFTCLPHLDTTGPQTEECAFGLKSDAGEYYAVNFGAGADAMNQFQAQQHITAEGFVVPKEALSSDNWAKYTMKGIFTITKVIEPTPATSTNGKLNINVVCESALAYMSFPNGASADAFVADCKEGKHPEVIERYRADMNLGDGALI